MAFSLLGAANLLAPYVFPKVERIFQPSDTGQPSLAACLPPEILSIIFLNYVHTPQRKSGTYEPRICCTSKTGTSPLPLAHVCSSWRSVALSTSRLWSRLHITGPTLGQLALAEMWLELSGNQQLSLSFKQQPRITHSRVNHTCTFGDLGQVPTMTFGLFSIFIRRVHRWEEIDFNLWPSSSSGPSSSRSVFAPLVGVQVPQLKSIAFTADLKEVWAAAYRNPFLRSVHFGDGQFPQRPRDILWSQLTTLRCDKIAEEHFWFISYHCQALQSLHAEFCDFNFDPERATVWHSPVPEELPFVSLPHLRKLTVVFKTDPISGVFKHLQLPAMQKMTVGQACEPRNPISEDILENVYKLLISSECPLEKLRLPSYLVTDNFIDSLGAASNLFNLSVLELEWADADVLQRLTLGAFPNLRKLIISNCFASEDCLTELLYSRIHSLKQASISLGYGSEINGMPFDIWFRGPKFEIYDCHGFDIRTKRPRDSPCFYCGVQCNALGGFRGVFQ